MGVAAEPVSAVLSGGPALGPAPTKGTEPHGAAAALTTPPRGIPALPDGWLLPVSPYPGGRDLLRPRGATSPSAPVPAVRSDDSPAQERSVPHQPNGCPQQTGYARWPTDGAQLLPAARPRSKRLPPVQSGANKPHSSPQKAFTRVRTVRQDGRRSRCDGRAL